MIIRTYTLLGPDRQPYQSATPGVLGGHRRSRVYGRLDCRVTRSGQSLVAPTSGIACSSLTNRPPSRPGTGNAPWPDRRAREAEGAAVLTMRGLDFYLAAERRRTNSWVKSG
jgi:hypothetical protein